jgi:hypothetical protein
VAAQSEGTDLLWAREKFLFFWICVAEERGSKEAMLSLFGGYKNQY